MRRHRVSRIDNFKWIAALLVAANHTSPLESVNGTADFLLTRVLARIAVPFFFMVTGYFVLSANTQTKVFRSIKKTAKLYLGATLLYLPIQVYKFVQSMDNIMPEAEQAGGLAIQQAQSAEAVIGHGLRITDLLQAVLFDGTYYHLWYLPAVILGLLIVTVLLKYIPGQALPVTIVLYGFGLLGDSYYGITEKILPLKTMYDGIFTVFSYTRNGLFMAPLFLLLGWKVACKQQRYLDEDTVSCEAACQHFVVAVLAFISMALEALLLLKYEVQRHDSMYLWLPVCMWYLFIFLTKEEQGKTGDKQTKRTGTGPRHIIKKGIFFYEGPMVFYVVHPFAILVVRGFVKVTKMQFFLTISPLYYLAVVIGGLCGTYAVLLGKKYVKKLRRGH